MAERLNDRRIAAHPIPTLEERQRDYWDDTLRGFGVRVSYGGKRAFVVRNFTFASIESDHGLP